MSFLHVFHLLRCIFLYVNDSADDFPLYFPSPVQKNAFAELLKNVMEKMEVSNSVTAKWKNDLRDSMIATWHNGGEG